MSVLIDSLTEALRAHPEATPLRLHLAELLLNEGQRDRAISELGAVLGETTSEAVTAIVEDVRRRAEPSWLELRFGWPCRCDRRRRAAERRDPDSQ